MKPLRLQTDEGTVLIDPDQDPRGYAALLGRSAVHRTRLEREDADAEALPSVQSQIERGRSDAANDPRYGGFASQWAPFFEAPRVLGENSGKPYTTNVRSLDLPTSGSMASLTGDYPSESDIETLRRSPLKARPASGVSALRGSAPDFYASLASLQRGR